MQQPVLFCSVLFCSVLLGKLRIQNKISKRYFKFTLGNRAILCLCAGNGFFLNFLIHLSYIGGRYEED